MNKHPVRRCERLTLEGLGRDRGWSKIYRGQVIRQDMASLKLSKDMTLDRRVWRLKIQVEG